MWNCQLGWELGFDDVGPSLQFPVERRVAAPLRAIERYLDHAHPERAHPGALAGDPRLDFIIRSLRPAPNSPIRGPFRTLSARTSLRGGLGRPIAVVTEVQPWSRAASTLSVRPAARHPSRWSRRRQQRYFDAAHELSAGLAATLNELVAPVAPRRDVACERRTA
jgi:hypothetical protein